MRHFRDAVQPLTVVLVGGCMTALLGLLLAYSGTVPLRQPADGGCFAITQQGR